MLPKKYFVLLVDLAGSQDLPDRENGTRKLKEAINNLNKDFRDDLYAPMEITRGDEAAAVLKRITTLHEMLLNFMIKLQPFKCRMVITYNVLTAGLGSKRSTEIDGPGFYEADTLMHKLKKSHKLFAIGTDNPVLDSAISSIINLVLLRWEEMTPFQRKVIHLYAQGIKQDDIANVVKRTQQQVSQVVRAVSYDILREAEESLKALIDELQSNLRERSANG